MVRRREGCSLTCNQVVPGMKIEAIVTKTPGKLELLELEKQTLVLATFHD